MRIGRDFQAEIPDQTQTGKTKYAEMEF